jgi:hypothetical protein
MKHSVEWNKTLLLQSPMFAPLYPALASLKGDKFPSMQDCNALLAARQSPITVMSGWPLCFVAQKSGKPSFEEQYEPLCFLKGEVQTREHNWHDLLNALVWLTFSKSKMSINARHYQALTEAPNAISTQRGTVRDMNTLFDESGVIVVCADAELALLLREFRWKELFWQRREQVQTGMGFYLFGHGLYEKALQPYIGLTGQGLLIMVGQEYFAWQPSKKLEYLDSLVANYLNTPEHCRSTRELTPVPLLGVPGWATNNNCEYYDNTAYFRPGRRSKGTPEI